MRTLLGITALAGCLTLVGCKASSSRDGLFTRSTSSNGSGALFQGSPTPTGSSGASSRNTPPPLPSDAGALASSGPGRREGVLAGRILDHDSKLRPGAIIQVIDLDAPQEDAAPLSVLANRDGYFDISGLEAGRSYRLVARVKDGDRTITGTARVVAPNVRVAIWLTEEASDVESTPEVKTSNGPAASLGTPIKTPNGSGTTIPLSEEDHPRAEAIPPVITTDPTQIAEGHRPPRDYDAPLVNVPSVDATPSNALPAPPPATPEVAPPSDSARLDEPTSNVRVPSCVRSGNRVENFALYDSKGEVYELSRDRKGKVVLIDVWHTRCSPCIRAIPHLNKLHNKYSRFGLEILGVAYEKGSLEEKQQAIERLVQRTGTGFNYRILFGGASRATCPFADQLQVRSYPTLILLDSTGRIIYRAEGMDEQTAYELEMAIYEQLFSRRTAERR